MIIDFPPAIAVLVGLLHAAAVGASLCPCVPDTITFQYDFSWGCSNAPPSQDFSGRKCSVSWWASNSAIQKILMYDVSSEETADLTPELMQSDADLGLETTYSFVYHRSYNAPSMLLLDFYTTSSASGSPVASIDLYYGRTQNCMKARNPMFWPGDQFYFVKVLDLVETGDPQCQFPGEEMPNLLGQEMPKVSGVTG